MSRSILPALAVTAAFVLTACMPSGGGKGAKTGAIPFAMTHDAGMAAVESSGKPPMFFFTADW